MKIKQYCGWGLFLVMALVPFIIIVLCEYFDGNIYFSCFCGRFKYFGRSDGSSIIRSRRFVWGSL